MLTTRLLNGFSNLTAVKTMKAMRVIKSMKTVIAMRAMTLDDLVQSYSSTGCLWDEISSTFLAN